MKSFLVIIVLALSSLNLYSKKEWVKLGEVAPEPNFMQLTCVDSNNCFTFLISQDILHIYKSTDKGYNWVELYSKFINEQVISKCNVIDSRVLQFFSNRVLYETANGALTFDTINIDNITGATDNLVFTYRMYSEMFGIGMTMENFHITIDKWKTYKTILYPDSIRVSLPITFLDSDNLLFTKEVSESARYSKFIIPHISFYKYNITNNEWTLYNERTDKLHLTNEPLNINNIEVSKNGVFYAVGVKYLQDYSKNDYILKSVDYGKNWKKLLDKESNLAGELMKISFRDENHGIVVGEWGKILETTDGGISWFQYPLQTEMMCENPIITWAGDTPLFAASEYGVYSLQTLSGIEELNSNEKFKVYKFGNNLEIAINDPSNSTYNYKLYTSSGKSLMTQDIGSTYGFVFEPVELIDLNNGVYYYTITKNNTVEFTGKLIVVE